MVRYLQIMFNLSKSLQFGAIVVSTVLPIPRYHSNKHSPHCSLPWQQTPCYPPNGACCPHTCSIHGTCRKTACFGTCTFNCTTCIQTLLETHAVSTHVDSKAHVVKLHVQLQYMYAHTLHEMHCCVYTYMYMYIPRHML